MRQILPRSPWISDDFRLFWGPRIAKNEAKWHLRGRSARIASLLWGYFRPFRGRIHRTTRAANPVTLVLWFSPCRRRQDFPSLGCADEKHEVRPAYCATSPCASTRLVTRLSCRRSVPRPAAGAGSITIVGPGGEKSYTIGAEPGSIAKIAVEGSYTKIVRRNKGETDAAMQDRVQSAVNQLRVSQQPLHEPRRTPTVPSPLCGRRTSLLQLLSRPHHAALVVLGRPPVLVPSR